jgi:membrane protein DedA with SNARE-associated domain
LDWPHLVDAMTGPVAGAGILIQSAGVPFPGELLLLAAAAWATARHAPLGFVVVAAVIGAVAGSDGGYLLGHRGRRPFLERFGALFRVRAEHLARAELVFARHGDLGVLITHFVVGLRTWGSMLAGMAGMPFWRFQVLSAAGGLVWIAVVVTLGYLVGENLGLFDAILRAIGIGGVVFIAVIAAFLVVAQERATRRR